jgi:exoribonuclease-2
METGHVVEFIDSNRIVCAVVLELKKLRLRLLTENNREVKLSAGRLVHHTPLGLDGAEGRSRLVSALKEIAERRHKLSQQIDIRELWEILNSEQEWIDLGTMTAFCFRDGTDADCQSAVIRAFFNDRLYFKFKMNQFRPHTPDQVAAIVQQKEVEAQKERLILQGAAWIGRVMNGESPPRPDNADTICEVLSSYYLLEKESPHRETARAILKKAGTGSPTAIFTFLSKIGLWHPDENLDLLRFGIRGQFSAMVESHAETLCRNATVVLNGRRDLRSHQIITIDGPSTVDFDDALSISREGDHLIVGIHITDVGYFVSKGDPLDQAAKEQCSTIYMPDGKIPMLPPALSEGACSLKAGQDRPGVSTMIRITAKAEIIDFEIVPSLIRVTEQLTFQTADAMTASDENIRTLHAIAATYRQQRLQNGALLIDLPEINVWLNGEGTPAISRTNRESPGRMLVSELMILANEMAARFLVQNDLPAIFRSQPEPRERLFENSQGSLFQNWMQRKLINRFVLGSTPERHAGLGLEQYITATSPIRKYSDLVTQRQLRAASGLEAPYSRQEIDTIIAASEEPLRQVARIQYRRHRYWLLKYLQSRTGQKEEAMVLYKRRDGYMILLQNYMLECRLSGAEGFTLRPEDLIRVTLQHVNARSDILTVVLG